MLPGLLAVFCRRFDLSLRLPVRASYLLPCVLGYAGGMLATYCALWFSWFGDQGQPALLYLVPGTLGTTLAMGTLRGQLGALWSCDFEAWADEEYAAERRRRAAAAEEEQMREAEAGLEHHLMPSGHFAGPSSPSRERLLPASPFERSRSGSRSDGAN